MQRLRARTETRNTILRRALRDRKLAGAQRGRPGPVPLPLNYRVRVRNIQGGGTWATFVKSLRAASGITGAELARRLNVDRATIWRWEAGRQKPESPDIVQAVASIFGIDIEDALEAAGLRPSSKRAVKKTEPRMDPLAVEVARILSDPTLSERDKALIRAQIDYLLRIPREESRRPRRRRDA